jgi:CDP-diacylglycerol--glycerol-3-phosphate 3-phosphatidyltransferase
MPEIFSKDRIKFYLSDPNTLTLARVAAAPVIVVLLLFPNRPCTFLAALLFSAASITDYLDGFFARQQVST